MKLRVVYAVTALAAAIGASLTPLASAVDSGGKIVFATNRAPNLYRGALYSIRENGSGRRRELLARAGASNPVFSADRRRILFEGHVEGAVMALYIARSTGAGERRLTPPGMSVHYGFSGGAAFSPDGKRVAFAARSPCDFSDCGPWAIYVVRTDGTGLRRIVANGVLPSWSRDGRKVAYWNNERARVFVVRIRDRRVWGLGRGSGPVWAPRGDLLVFSPGRGRALCFVRPATSSRRCVAGPHAGEFVWSRDGRRVAFQQSEGGELGVVNRDGTGLRILSPGPERSVPAAWSPDGRRIAYVYGKDEPRRPGPGYELYIRSAIGDSVPRRVTREPDGTIFGPVFWDRGRIRYLAHRLRNDFEIAVINPDGTGLELLTRNELLSDVDPAWSPDGRTIVFSRGRLYAMSASGSAVRPLTESGPWTDTNPAWSPSGDRIAFVRTPPGLQEQPPGTLMIRDPDGRERLITQNVKASRLSWSPDGRFLVYGARTFYRDLGLHIFDSSTGDIRRLETGREFPQAPSWSPDGERIAFVALGQTAPRRTDLFTIRPDGTDLALVAHNAADGGNWSPDGRRIVFTRSRTENFVTQLVVVNVDGSGETVLTRNYSANLGPDWSR